MYCHEKQIDSAIAVLEQAMKHDKLREHQKINTMLIDLLIARDSDFEEIKEAFDATLDNRVANVTIILKYCQWLKDDCEA